MTKKKRSMKKIFHEVWEREKQMDKEGASFMQCIDCPKKLYESVVTHWNFSHEYGKNSHPEHKYNPLMIKPRCMACHMKKDHALTLKTEHSN